MRADTSAIARKASAPSARPRVSAPPTNRWSRRAEAAAVALILMIGATLRFTLSARGWPQMNSDEAVMGLMTDDILWHNAHPVFFYGQQYMGALQAYLAVPLFALLGPTNLALHVTTALETLAFLTVLWAFVRAVYSPSVALITLALLALGSRHAVNDTLHAGAGAQDTLLFGTLLLLLVYLRLRRPRGAWSRRWLDLGIGLAIGLGIWGDVLIVPFVVPALLALGVEAYHRIARTRSAVPSAVESLAIICAGIVAGLLPPILANIASNGATLTQVLAAAELPGVGQPGSGLLERLHVFGLQILATLIVGLPRALGSSQLCVNCAAWPAPGAPPLPLNEILRLFALSLPFSLAAIALWVVEALSLARQFRQSLLHGPSCIRLRSSSSVPSAPPAASDARRWGRAMLVLVAALTVLPYTASGASYFSGNGSTVRYLVGLFACAPLIVDPLWRWSEPVWRSLASRSHRYLPGAFSRISLDAPALRDRERNSQMATAIHQVRGGITVQPQMRVASSISFALLAALFVLYLTGAADAIMQTRDSYQFGMPASGQDAQLLSFLEAHDVTRFYATYGTCYRLVFEAREQVLCSVASDTDMHALGNNRIPAYVSTVAAVRHPAYVFATTVSRDDPHLPAQVARLIGQHDPRFAGYTVAHLSGFVVYYFAGLS